jgi:DNA-binding MarR family transcriptional regulator
MIKARLTPEGMALTAMFLKLFRVNGLLLMTGDRLTSDHGLTSARWQVMGAIADSPLTVAQIARNMGLKRQSVQRLVNVLSQQALLSLIDNPNHRRARLVQMTGTGRRQYEEISHIQAHWVNSISKGLDVKDLNLALEQLREIEERLKREPSETQAARL